MKRFTCVCGHEVYFDNRFCVVCHHRLVYIPETNTIISLDKQGEDLYTADATGHLYRLCQNHIVFGVCNCAIDATSKDQYCRLCSSNRIIPDTDISTNLRLWEKIEQAKRRLYYGLATLGLHQKLPYFDILDGTQTTGYTDNVVAINLSEADDVQRTWQKKKSREGYRTVLGHMRHEIGHFFLEAMSIDPEGFDKTFGTRDPDYNKALQAYYHNGPLPGWQDDYISAYASLHPLEDWAECFAHYLHINDLVETAYAFHLLPVYSEDFLEMLQQAAQFGAFLNELNRSLGNEDAYPFIFSEVVTRKLLFIDRCVRENRM